MQNGAKAPLGGVWRGSNTRKRGVRTYQQIGAGRNGGIIGGVVDGGNGASNTLAPRPLKVRLSPIGSGKPAMLIDKDGKELMTVAEHNEKVRADVARTIGADSAGMTTSQPK